MKAASRVILILCFLALNSCSTSTEKANLISATTQTVGMVGLAISPQPAPLNTSSLGSPVKHQIHVKGAILCDKEMFPNFRSMQVELWDNDQLTSIIKIEANGSFDSINKSVQGEHSLRLVAKQTNEILDTVTFKSTKNVDQFDLNLKICK